MLPKCYNCELWNIGCLSQCWLVYQCIFTNSLPHIVRACCHAAFWFLAYLPQYIYEGLYIELDHTVSLSNLQYKIFQYSWKQPVSSLHTHGYENGLWLRSVFELNLFITRAMEVNSMENEHDNWTILSWSVFMTILHCVHPEAVRKSMGRDKLSKNDHYLS